MSPRTGRRGEIRRRNRQGKDLDITVSFLEAQRETKKSHLPVARDPTTSDTLKSSLYCSTPLASIADAAVTEIAIEDTRKVMNSFRPTLALAGFRGSSGPSQPTKIKDSLLMISCVDGPFSTSGSFGLPNGQLGRIDEFIENK